MKTTYDLKDKQVLILGGSAGMGLATGIAAAQEGAIVTLVSKNQGRLEAAAAQMPGDTAIHAVDLSDENAIRIFFDGFGNFDHLVYTAGENLSLAGIKDLDLDGGRAYFNIRYWGAVAAVKYGAPHINPGGAITLTSGIAAIKPNAGWSIGSSICAAMESFTRVMAVELAPVRVNIVSPGLVRTNLWDSLPPADRDGLFATVANTLPVGYVATPDEIAQTYLYLMKQSYSTGQQVIVDGGNMLL
jgi:NAD(P)-dependent dehydrogenase (short-subunit alcohol dehydrogenase family)